MKPFYVDEAVTLYHGDALAVLAELDTASVDAVCTDPPYGLGFMGQQWDQPGQYGSTRRRERNRPLSAGTVGRDHRTTSERSASMHAGDYDLSLTAMRSFQGWCESWAAECLRVLKPGGHLLAFGGTRTWHRLACAVEDAGFEIRDTISWLYGSGFPKSLDVSKAIDKAAGAQREVIGEKLSPDGVPYSALHGPRSGRRAGAMGEAVAVSRTTELLTAPATDDARRWSGWGTALKPAHEPIVARLAKPLQPVLDPA